MMVSNVPNWTLTNAYLGNSYWRCKNIDLIFYHKVHKEDFIWVIVTIYGMISTKKAKVFLKWTLGPLGVIICFSKPLKTRLIKYNITITKLMNVIDRFMLYIKQ